MTYFYLRATMTRIINENTRFYTLYYLRDEKETIKLYRRDDIRRQL